MRQELFAVYKMSIAHKLIARGHEVAYTMPNPKKPAFIVWVFRTSDAFFEDFNDLQGGSYGRK